MKKLLLFVLALGVLALGNPVFAAEQSKYKTMSTSGSDYGVTATTGKYVKEITCTGVNGKVVTIVTGTALSGTGAIAGAYGPATNSTVSFNFRSLNGGLGNYSISGFTIKSTGGPQPVCTVIE
jgi:hypothetical protein